jgi:hypothetical protein
VVKDLSILISPYTYSPTVHGPPALMLSQKEKSQLVKVL